MNILVTGGAGYIGSHIVKILLEKQENVFIFDNLSKGHKKLVLGGTFIKGDLKDKQTLSKLFKDNEIEAVIHLAANSLTGESVENPKIYYQNNIVNGLNLLDTMIENNVTKIIFSSSAGVYGTPNKTPITEDFKTEPESPYAESKLFFEKILDWYSKAYKINYISLRYFNAAGADRSGKIGELHNPETHLIPIIIKKALGQIKEFYLFGDDYPTFDGTCIRDYIHVSDLADAHILALDRLIKIKENNIYNLGSEAGYSVKEVIKVTEKIIGSKINYKISKRRAGDPSSLVASSKKIKKELGWDPKFSDLETIIKTAVIWHKNN